MTMSSLEKIDLILHNFSMLYPSWLDRKAYPFDSHELDLAGGARMHYVDQGNGPPILFVHGTPSWSFEWRHLIRGLAHDHRCVAPDLVGFGLSSRPRAFPYTPAAHADALAEFVEQLDLQDVTLVVHDFGGPIGLPLALAERSRVRRVVIVNTWMWSLAGDPEMQRAARIVGGQLGKVLYRWANLSLRAIMPSAYADRKRLTPAIHAQYLAPFPDRWSRGAVLWPLAHALLGSSKYYESLWARRTPLLELPVLIVWGMNDPAFGRRHLAKWKESLPHARVVELLTGHWPHEEAPDAVVEAVRSFTG
jgi:haloalkane dehalogenase